METIHKLAERLDLGIWAAAGAVGLQILLIISLALAAQMVSTRLIRTVRIRIASRMTDGEQIRRAETLGRVLRYFATVLITVIAAIMVLSAVGISIAPFLGAAGVVEALLSVLAIRDQVAPPTINLDNPDPECDLDYVPHTARQARVDVALSNSFGFGGTNGTLIFRRFNG